MNKIKQKYIIASVATLILGTFFVSSYFGSLGGEKNIKNNQASVLSSILDFFGFDQVCTPEAVPAGSIVNVDDENNTINVIITGGNLNSMCFVPNIQTVYSKAVVTPDPSEPQDFTNPVTYTINQDGFIKEYVMSVKVELPTSVISTCRELQNINANLSGDYTLANNIDCSDTINWTKQLGEDFWLNGFEPIGDDSGSFTGSFNGNGYTISNLYIYPNNDYSGLFGYVTGNISNVGLLNVDITGNRYTGGLVGQLSNGGTITNSYSTGKVTGDSYTGGLIGLSSSVISNSYSSAVVDGGIHGFGGGLVGGLAPDYGGTISNSYATGDISSSLGSGGLVGQTWSGVTISNSYAIGKINNDANHKGGLIAWAEEGGILENSYWDINTSEQTISAGGEGKTTSEMQTQSTFFNWDISIWRFVDGAYPTLNNGITTVVVTATPVSTGGGATGGGSTGGGTMVPVSFDGGTGTMADPYQISDWKQLNSVRSKPSSYYMLTSDLTSASDGYADFGDKWTPIGNSGSPFTGSFKGNGKTISNLKINSSSISPIGLFGYISSASISNLGLLDISINSDSDYVGTLVGLMGSGEINQSYSTGNISGSKYVGGLVGYMGSGIISNSYSNVKITNFTSHAGGLVGQQYDGSITYSYSTGLVTVSSESGTPYGGLIGVKYPKGNVTNSYWDKDTSGQTASAGGVGVVGKTIAEMKTPTTFVGWNFEDIWGIDASENNGYPALNPSALYIEPIVPVEPVVITNTADLNCTLSRISPPLTSSNEVSVNNNTVWKASSTCPTCTVNWSVTDTNNPNPPMASGTNPWSKIFTTVGSKTVTAQLVSPSGASGTACTATTTVVQTGGATEL